MSRRRDLSTDISTDKKFKSDNISDLAALLYTWMIPHADDSCRLIAKDPEEVNLLVWPNRRKTDEETAACIEELLDAGLIGQDDTGNYFFPSTSFYKYNTKIPVDKRVVTPALRQRRPAVSAKSPENSEECRSAAKPPEKGVLPSPSPSPSLLKSRPPDPGEAPDLSEKRKLDQEIQEIFLQTKEIAGGDHKRAKDLCNFVGKTLREGEHLGDSRMVIHRAILDTLGALRARASKEGKPIDQALLWPYLQQTYKAKRAKSLQAECQEYKHAPPGKFGEILDLICRRAKA